MERLLARELDLVVLGGVAFEPIRFQDEIAIQRVPYPFDLRTSYAILTHRQRTLGPAAGALREAIRSVARG